MAMLRLEDRVRRNTAGSLNQQIDNRLKANIIKFADATSDDLTKRIRNLDCEWDIERYIEMNAPIFAGIGLVLGLLVSPYWFILSIFVLGFLFLHAVQGWCPPVPLFRWFGIRTQKEIELERQVLKHIRGDYGDLTRRNGQKDRLDIDALIDTVSCTETANPREEQTTGDSVAEEALP